jgi:photosystem II stability/assembly factor-like uncharacterized protein
VDVVHLATNRGLVGSTDGGHHWSMLPVCTKGFGVLAFDPQKPKTLYCGGGDDDLHRSEDGGMHWERIGPPNNVGALAFSAAEQGLFTAGWGVQVSHDEGSSWSNLLDSGRVESFSLADGSPPTLYVTRTQDTNVRSDDGGATWKPMSTGAQIVVGAGQVAFAPARRGTAYATVADRLFVSRDGGQHWRALAETPHISVLGLAASDPRVLYIAGMDGAFRSRDGGASWTRAPLPGSASNQSGPIHVLAVDPSDAKVVYTEAFMRGFLRSRDGGNTWTTIPSPDPEKRDLLELTVDRRHVVYARTMNGSWRSRDGGATWEPRGDEADDWPLGRRVMVEAPGDEQPLLVATPVAVVPPSTQPLTYDRVKKMWNYELRSVLWAKDHRIGYNAGHALFKTTDGGASWRMLPAPSVAGVPFPMSSIAIDPNDARVLLVATGAGIFRSVTGGE